MGRLEYGTKNRRKNQKKKKTNEINIKGACRR